MTAIAEDMTTPTLFRHKKKSEWGVGVLAGEDETRLRLQFEDGTFRTIAKTHDHLLEKVDNPSAETTAALGALLSERQEAMKGPATKSRGPDVSPTEAIATQLERFMAAYPEGFADDKWVKEIRGEGQTRKLKSYRIIGLDAAKPLGREALKKALAEGTELEVFEAVVGLYKKTDLATVKTDVRPLTQLDEMRRREFAQALAGLLLGEDALNLRVDRFIAELLRLGVKPTWSLVTVPLGFAQPEAHAVIRPATVRKQAQRLGIAAKAPSPPTGRSYQAALQVVRSLDRKLRDRELQPRDLLDVGDFMAVSLKGL